MIRCPKCGSTKINETWQVWAPEGMKSMRCDSCYHTWWVGATSKFNIWLEEHVT